MHLDTMIKQLKDERRKLDGVILTLEQLRDGKPRRGRPPKVLSELGQQAKTRRGRPSKSDPAV